MKKTKKNINEKLMIAVRSGSAKDVKRCLSGADCDPLALDDGGYTALMWAARKGHEECVKLLLPVSDPLVRDHDGWSALMWAALKGHEDCVKLVLPVSDPLARSNHGRSALMWAACYGHEACVKLVLPVSDPLALGKDGHSASQIARDNGYPAVVSMINAYVLSQKEAALLSTDTLPAPPRRAPVIRI